jgi:hypothetical protein
MKVIDVRHYPNLDVNKLPEWILPQPATGLMDMQDLPLPAQIADFYEPITFKIRNSPPGDTRPYPDEHVSFTAEGFRDFKVFRKKNL